MLLDTEAKGFFSDRFSRIQNVQNNTGLLLEIPPSGVESRADLKP